MQVKLFEIRDAATFVPAMAIRLEAEPDSEDMYLLRRSGYGKHSLMNPHTGPYVILIKLDGVQAQYDPYEWTTRTMREAHNFIVQHWEDLDSGAVIDVEFIIGKTQFPKRSERFTAPAYD